ncbi:MAG: aminopeptidase P family protein [Thermococci archaeon]|nr:aminopeptidase P family protein [Thermococci archaeon]
MRGQDALFRRRLERFQEALRKHDVDGAAVRTLSTFTYFTGTKWLRPALFVPAEGEPIVFVTRGEAEEFRRRSWVERVVEFNRVEELMAGVVGWIRRNGMRRVGLEFSVERDSYLLFFKIFKRLNPSVEVVDVLDIVMGLRMIKDDWELDSIRRAGRVVRRGMEVAEEVIRPGMSELEVSAEILRELMLRGSEDPKVYVSTTPRAHAEPFRDLKVPDNGIVTVVIGADWNHYYANAARTFVVGDPGPRVERAIEVKREATKLALERTKVGVPLSAVEREVAGFIEDSGFGDSYVAGYTHGVGLLIEEPPISTIVVPHRAERVRERMVLAIMHSPLMVPEGAVKHEDTYVVWKKGLERVT